jgi:uncharacterized protein YukE
MVNQGEPMRINPDGVRAAAARIDTAGADFAGHGRELMNKLTGEGPCWGDDESGQNFAKDYVPSADALTKAIYDVSQAIVQIAANLRTQADAAQQTDTGAAQNLGNQQV